LVTDGTAKAGDTDQIGAIERAEYRLALEAAGDLCQALAGLLVMARRERAGISRQPLQTQRLECRRVLRAKPSPLAASRKPS
jgi:hypothetical protein